MPLAACESAIVCVVFCCARTNTVLNPAGSVVALVGGEAAEDDRLARAAQRNLLNDRARSERNRLVGDCVLIYHARRDAP